MSPDDLDQQLSRALARRPPPPPPREFDAHDLARFDRGLRRKFCEAILTESGARLVDARSSAAHDELLLHVTPLWVRRTLRVRIAARPLDQRALDRLAARVRAAGDVEGVMIAAHGLDGTCTPDRVVRLVEPDELIARLRRSALIAWPGRKPELAFERLPGSRQLTQPVTTLDAVGIRWLPMLALGALPAEICDLDQAPQQVLERVAFRLLTSVFRFGGERLSASQRASARAPDAVLRWPAGNPVRDAALVACVAAPEGYAMDDDDELLLGACVEAARERAVDAGCEPAFVIVLSSDFPGPRGRRHPYHPRAEALARGAGVRLVYVRAVDLARLAVAVEGSEMPPAVRDALPWSQVLSAGVLRFEDLERLLES
ncbi:MAG: hypothetical protein M3N04_00975 [Actinomycetota bacterium]|nr:hypothetical protein [Actinomycetota bacterium]